MCNCLMDICLLSECKPHHGGNSIWLSSLLYSWDAAQLVLNTIC